MTADIADLVKQFGSALGAISEDAFDRLTAIDAARKVEDRIVEELWIELRRSAYPALRLQSRGGASPGDLVCSGLFANEFKLAYRAEHSYSGDASWRAGLRQDLAKLRRLREPHRLFTQIVSFGPMGQYQRYRDCVCRNRDSCTTAWVSALANEGLTSPAIFSRGILTLLVFEVNVVVRGSRT